MKIAHLILTHKNPVQLHYLVNALDHPAFDFYIHVDKKKNEAEFKGLFQQRENVFFIEKRAKIYWGDWGTIQATLNGFELILSKEYDYVNVISGQDFPIKSTEYIYKYLMDHKGTEFITCDVPDKEWKNVSSRFKNYHLINWHVPGKHRLEKIITKILPARVFPLNYSIVGRANWFTLTTTAIRYCLDFLKGHPEMARYFKYVWGADEFIFSTILYNSSFQKKIRDNLVYVDWSGKDVGHPQVLTSKDFDLLKLSGKLFARKFDMEIDALVFNMLEELIK